MSFITISYGKLTSNISYSEDDRLTLYSILKQNGYQLNSSCTGNGFCNKCIVICEGKQVKSCTYIPHGNINVTLPDTFNISSDSATDRFVDIPLNIHGNSDTSFSVAMDIGSTSISVALVKHDPSCNNVTAFDNSVIDICTFTNPTISYGTDIISRAANCVGKNCRIMAKLLTDSLESKTTCIIAKNNLNIDYLDSIYIACNTTMQHILLALDCSGILQYPFKPAKFSHSLIYKNYPVHIIPSFSAFVGGDIVSGLYYLNPSPNNNYLFLDIGTNAEIVLHANNKIYCTATAAGPAFEGAHISCGTAYIDGAVYSVTIHPFNNRVTYKTINNKLPCGICGTGILDAYSEMIRTGVIDEYKTFNEKYTDKNFEICRSQNGIISITQNDIRQIQLAISAIRTGIEILLSKAGITANNIDKLYIAGSFGSSLSFNTLKNIDLLPDAILNHDIINFVGNTSLSGAVKSALHKITPDYFSNTISSCIEIELALDPDFNNLFLKYM